MHRFSANKSGCAETQKCTLGRDVQESRRKKDEEHLNEDDLAPFKLIPRRHPGGRHWPRLWAFRIMGRFETVQPFFVVS